MKIPIPDDWNGSDWFCAEVRWPDSPLWTAILTGFLAAASHGYFWDERTGTITEVQKIGREIFNANFPYVPCSDCEPDDSQPIGEVSRIIGECIMTECSVPYGALKWIDGVLYFRYCGEWYQVPGEPAKDTPIGEDYEAPEIDGGGYSACGKAEAVMDMVLGVVTSIFDEVGNFSWQWWGHIKGDNPGVGMDAKWIITACYGAVNQVAADNAAGPAYEPDAFDASTWQSVKCRLALDFSDTMPEPLGGNEIRTKLQNYFASEWGVDLLTNAVFVDALRAINRESFEDAVKLGASYGEADCSCPQDNTALASRVYFTGAYDPGNASGAAIESVSIDYGGKRVKCQIAYSAGGADKNIQDILFTLGGVEEGDYIQYRIYPTGGSPNAAVPARPPTDYTSEPPVTEWMKTQVNGGGTMTDLSDDSKQYSEWLSEDVQTATPLNVEILSAYRWPEPSGADVRHAFTIEITHLNGEYLGAIGP